MVTRRRPRAELKIFNVCAGLVIVAPAQPPDQGWSESNSPGDVGNPRGLHRESAIQLPLSTYQSIVSTPPSHAHQTRAPPHSDTTPGFSTASLRSPSTAGTTRERPLTRCGCTYTLIGAHAQAIRRPLPPPTRQKGTPRAGTVQCPSSLPYSPSSHTFRRSHYALDAPSPIMRGPRRSASRWRTTGQHHAGFGSSAPKASFHVPISASSSPEQRQTPPQAQPAMPGYQVPGPLSVSRILRYRLFSFKHLRSPLSLRYTPLIMRRPRVFNSPCQEFS
jgi:hypothetical protein